MDSFVKISDKLNKHELKKLKFLAYDIIPPKELDYIFDASILFHRIFNNFKSLKDISFMLTCINRSDLCELLNDNDDTSFGCISSFRLLLFKICSRLNSENRKDIIFLSEISSQDQDKLVDNEDLILYLEKKYFDNHRFLNFLSDCCGSIKRNDLELLIKDFIKNNDEDDNNLEPTLSRSNSEKTISGYYSTFPGLCLIFNFENFDHNPKKIHKKRIGSEFDKISLITLFRDHFHYDVHCHEDLNNDTFIKKLENYSKQDLSIYNCFICFILSHGAKGRIFTSDNHSVTIKQICQYFYAKNCEQLKGKPKIFFINACQKDLEEDEIDVKIGGELELFSESDFCVHMSSVFGEESIRSRTKGTYFIQSIVEAFHKYAGSHSFAYICSFINEGVNERSNNRNLLKKSSENTNMCTPIYVSTLAHNLHFNYIDSK